MISLLALPNLRLGNFFPFCSSQTETGTRREILLSLFTLGSEQPFLFGPTDQLFFFFVSSVRWRLAEWKSSPKKKNLCWRLAK
jgi:hypothetical protein